MNNLKFTRVNNEQYNTVSIKIENAFIQIKEDVDYNIIDIEKNKFGYRQATIKLDNQDLIDKLKSWETEINEYLKSEIGTGPITILYGNKLYSKLSWMLGQDEKKHHIKIKSVWVNEKNKPFIQLYYVKHTT